MTEPEVIKKALKKLEACKELCHDSLGIHEFKVVKNALNKQIPMKPINYGGCPTCYQPMPTSPNYCPYCGQKLDWSATDK